MNNESLAPAYRQLSTTGMVAAIHRDWEHCFPNLDTLFGEVLREPGRILRGGGGQGVTALRVMNGQTFFVKVYLPGRMHRRIRDLCGHHRAMLEWQRNVAASDAGIRVAPVALALTEKKLWNTRHLVVTLPATGESAHELLRRHADSPAEIKELLTLLGREIARYHQLGFYHRHLKTSHLFLDDDRTFTCIDLEGSCIKHPLPTRLRLDNLGQIQRSLGKLPNHEKRFKVLEAAYEEAWKP